MITWGIISGAMAYVTTPQMFYIMRFLLGWPKPASSRA
jgi:hypothetical protein